MFGTMTAPSGARRLFAVLGLVLAFAAGARAELVEGRDYETLAQPQATEAGGKIEVAEFFWYGCPHCYRFEAALAKWLKTLPADVAFRRVHADFGRWGPGVRLFYALEAIGEETRVHGALFDAIHVARLNYGSEPDVTAWLARNGVDGEKFAAAYNSGAVHSQVLRAQQLTRAHGLDGVPSVVVGGKYRTSAGMASGYDALVAIIDELIVRVRAEQAKEK